MWIGRATLCLVVALSGVLNAAGDAHDGDIVTPFDLSSHGGVVVAVTVGGEGPYRLMVDTGSTHSVFTEALAAEVGARPIARALTTTSAGVRVVPVVAVGELVVGPVRTAVAPSVVDALPVEDEADGLLGQDVLAGQHYTIDLVRRQIIWHTAECASLARPARTVPVREVDGRFVVSAEVGRQIMDLVVDTASETLVVYGRAVPAGVAWTSGTGVDLETVAGRLQVMRGTVKHVRLGDVLQEDVDVVVLPRDVEAGQPAGLLPLRGFARVTVNGPRRELVFEADGPG